MGKKTIAPDTLRQSRWRVFAEWVLAAFLMALFVRSALVPAWRTLNTDFPNDYLVASLYRKGIPLDRAYEWEWLQRQNDHLGIPQKVAGFAPHPPLCALPVLPLTYLPVLQAKRVWILLNLGFLVGSTFVLYRAAEIPFRWVVLISLLCLYPLQVNFWLGQYYVLLLFLICSSYYAFRSGRELLSGILMSIAACLKILPLLFLLLFIRRKEWRATLGFVLGCLVLTSISVGLFGVEVHRVYLFEVFPRTILGDLLSPYSIHWNSFSALWHRLFLYEPELNPMPVLGSVAFYVMAQVLTWAALCFGFFGFSDADSHRFEELQWAAFTSLLLLLSPMPAPYQYCLLIFTGVLGVDWFWSWGKRRHAMVFLLLFVFTCAPLPARVASVFVLQRLAGNLLLYVFVLWALYGQKKESLRVNWRWVPIAAVNVALLATFCLWTLQGRKEDFGHRIPGFASGYRSTHPVQTQDRILWVRSASYKDGSKLAARDINGGLDQQYDESALAVTADGSGSSVYAEHAGETSLIVRLLPATHELLPMQFTEGQQPVLSRGGRWLAVLRQQSGQSEVWLFDLQENKPPRLMLGGEFNPLEFTVLQGGDLIASAGQVSEPHLVFVDRGMGSVKQLEGVKEPARYPSISPDSKRLAYGHRLFGAWRLYVLDLTTGAEEELTHGDCNATSPSWVDSRTILYATDCGRGLGMTAIAAVAVED